jgi:hypothetical protein
MAARMTSKYMMARILGEEFIDSGVLAKMTQPELYAALERKGFQWDGERWQQSEPSKTIKSPVGIRMSGHLDMVKAAADDVAAALIGRGYDLVSRSGYTPNDDHGTVRHFMTVLPPRK